MFRFILACGWSIAVATSTFAQAPTDDPYAIPRSAVTGWPKFYKPLKITPHDQLYYAMGWCRTNHYFYKPSDLVDIDTLDEIAERGRVIEVRDSAIIAWFDSADRPIAVHVHPEATSLVVRGPLTRRVLKPGEFVRFVGSVDSTGRVAAPLERVEICAPPAASLLPSIAADAEGPIVGKLVRVRRDELTLVVESGTVRRITATLDPKAAIVLEAADLRRATPGSRLALDGRVYRADNRIPADQVFATSLEIRLPGSAEFAPSALAAGPRAAGFIPAVPAISPGETLAAGDASPAGSDGAEPGGRAGKAAE